KAKQKAVKTGISAAQADLDESSASAAKAGKQLIAAKAQLGTAQQKLASTQQQLAAAQAVDAQMKAALVTAQQQLVDAQAALTAAKAQVVEQRAAVGRMAAESMQKVDPHLVGLVALMQANDPTSLSTEVQTVGNVLDREDKLLGDLRTAETAMTVQEKKVQDARDDVAQKQKDAAANLKKQQELTDQAASEEQDVQALVGSRAAAEKDAEDAKAADASELKALKKENDKIAAELKALAAKAVAGQSASYDNGGPLMRPVDGYVTSPFGYRVHPIYGYYSLHDGTDFHAPCGTPLKAAGNGKVIQEYFQSAWGNRLIVDLGQVNGHGVSVIYNHLSAYKAHTGDVVTRGETLGYAGTTGWSTGCHLHFTVMVDGEPKNPMDWF
ncbi:MAG: mepM 1, partial [Nocardioidaceae bacterium]|nr:mepM 1 [Nocardioidaceae bacterium]